MAHYDICVIGAGSGGLTVAAVAAQFGQKVALIEKGKMGGDCLNYGCVPSKALIAAAKQAQAFRTGTKFGIAPAEPRIDFKQVMEHVHGVIAAIEPNDSQERFEKLGVKVIRAAAEFVSPDQVEAGGETITARRFVVATGSTAAIPPIPGLADVPFLTNETIFENTELPGRLIVIGGGPIGMELAQAHRRLGAQVTVLEAFDPLAKDDPELAAFVLRRLVEEGIEILSRIEILAIRRTSKGVEAEIDDKGAKRMIAGTHLLVAAGRKPNVEGLGLELAGIAYDKRGIIVDAGLRTTNRKVYAIGDVAGGPQFTHVANYHAGLVIRNALFRLPVKATTDHIPRVTYMDPELAYVGLTEVEAKQRCGNSVSILRWPYHENDRAQAEREIQGLVKVVAGKGGRVLGAGVVGANAGELIAPWSLALSSNLRIKAFADTVMPYPTLSEASKRAATTYYSGLATTPWIRRVIGILAKFG
jgi:pyruvate/2-oxoglutarate dehydrogenase complex dihydrolipoamide dehydrogenase (E3) component